MTTRNEDIERLYTLFGQKTDLTRSIIANVLDGENGDFDKALEVLSKMTSDVTGTSNQNQKQDLSKKPASYVSTETKTDAEKVQELEKHKDIRNISNIFNNQLTESVIAVVYEKNRGDVVGTVDTLLDIQNDPDALQQIRRMNDGLQQRDTQSNKSNTTPTSFATGKNPRQPSTRSTQPVVTTVPTNKGFVIYQQREREERERQQREREERERRQHEREERERQQREKEERERQQREKEERERQQREREERERQQREREERERQQREREERERQQREKEERERQQREKEERERQQREREERERQQREREERERQQREKEERERRQREKEERERRQREKEERERQQREKEERERQQREKEERERRQREKEERERQQLEKEELKAKQLLELLNKRNEEEQKRIEELQKQKEELTEQQRRQQQAKKERKSQQQEHLPSKSQAQSDKHSNILLTQQNASSPSHISTLSHPHQIPSVEKQDIAIGSESETKPLDEGPEEETNQQLNKEEQDRLCILSFEQPSKTQLILTWKIKDEHFSTTKSDWIGFYRVGARNKRYITFIKTGSKREGTERITIPTTPGLYEFRYFSNGNLMIAKSPVLLVGPEVELRAQLVDNTKIQVTWALKGGDLSTRDWIGFYPGANDNRTYLWFSYLTSGRSTFEIDAPRKPGTYEFRFFPDGAGYEYTAKSNPIVIENRDKLTVSLTPKPDSNTTTSSRTLKVKSEIYSEVVSSSDWIGIYRAGDTNYIEYKYVNTTSGEVEFVAPWRPGQYLVKYYSKHAGGIIITQPFEIEDNDKLIATIEGTAIKVKWEINSTTVTSNDWIALYRAEEENNKNYLTSKYVDTKQNFMLFNKPTEPGKYEIRYFSAHLPKYDHLKKSNVITI